MAAHTRSAARIAAHHGQLPCDVVSNSAVTTPDKPATKPADRSISPRSSAKTSASASIMKTAPCTSRFTMLPEVRNFEFSD